MLKSSPVPPTSGGEREPDMSARESFSIPRWPLAVGVCVLAVGTAAAQGIRDRQVGRQPDGSVVVTTNQVITPAGRQVEFRGRPRGGRAPSGPPHRDRPRTAPTGP